MRVRLFLLGGVNTSAFAERTNVNTPPTGMTERTSFPRGCEYTRGTSFHTPEFHLVRVTIMITSEVSDVTQCVWLPDYSQRLGDDCLQVQKREANQKRVCVSEAVFL